MVPVGTTAMHWWCPAISLCWRCRPTARSSIQSGGFGTICAATGSPTRYFGASPTSWTPARWRGTGSPPTPAWSARSARSPGLRLRPLHSVCLLSNPGPDKETLASRNFRRSVLLIRGATVIDGSGGAPRSLDVAVRDGRISAVESRRTETAVQEIDASGRVLAPGFIDIHTHSDFTLPLNPLAEAKIRQGVTTEVVGNCGFSVAPALPGMAG